MPMTKEHFIRTLRLPSISAFSLSLRPSPHLSTSLHVRREQHVHAPRLAMRGTATIVSTRSLGGLDMQMRTRQTDFALIHQGTELKFEVIKQHSKYVE